MSVYSTSTDEDELARKRGRSLDLPLSSSNVITNSMMAANLHDGDLDAEGIDDKRKARGNYRCNRCNLPKKGITFLNVSISCVR
jgi:hypothetical protein